jgi:hypothetical protein
MCVEKRNLNGRDFWFTAEQVFEETPTGGYQPTGGYYCAFSVSEPGPLIQGEVLKDSEGRARLFASPDQAIAAGIREAQARLGLAPKAYAVGLPYGNKDAEFQVYVRLLGERGVDPGKHRVEDSYGRKWIHVWDNRDDAEQFAVVLRKETRNPDWEVYELSPPRPLGGDVDGQGPIDILVGRQSDGYTYGLHPNSFKLIRKCFPSVHPQPSIFMGRDAQTAYEVTNGARYDQIAVLLTGLSPAKLGELGGYRVVDPVTGLVLHESDTVTA